MVKIKIFSVKSGPFNVFMSMLALEEKENHGKSERVYASRRGN
jgi:uncharacterized glyoxalase superfamily metalloenzyme YdcJ